MKAVLVLEDGFSMEATVFTRGRRAQGEVVFNTGMTGYQEILTDPSYRGQLVTFTFPLIGNYGINQKDMESSTCHLEGVILREYCHHPSNWQGEMTVKDFLEKHGILGVEGVDTRALTRHLRRKGSLRGIVSTENIGIAALQQQIQESPPLASQNLVEGVTCKENYMYHQMGHSHVVVMDLGVKKSILEKVKREGHQVTVVPATRSPREILALKPHGVLLSNGPGDPRTQMNVVNTIKSLLGKVPLMGICLGHQLLGMALGMDIFKLKFGHHGSNHPVKNLQTGEVEITSQNHNYCLKKNGSSPVITHLNLHDKTIEGFEDREAGILSLQYHPEAAPGPREGSHYFQRFTEHIMSHQPIPCKKVI